jgi:hypothetical protein
MARSRQLNGNPFGAPSDPPLFTSDDGHCRGCPVTLYLDTA